MFTYRLFDVYGLDWFKYFATGSLLNFFHDEREGPPPAMKLMMLHIRIASKYRLYQRSKRSKITLTLKSRSKVQIRIYIVNSLGSLSFIFCICPGVRVSRRFRRGSSTVSLTYHVTNNTTEYTSNNTVLFILYQQFCYCLISIARGHTVGNVLNYNS